MCHTIRPSETIAAGGELVDAANVHNRVKSEEVTAASRPTDKEVRTVGSDNEEIEGTDGSESVESRDPAGFGTTGGFSTS